MTYDEFKKHITLGFCNAETHIGVTIFFTDYEQPENNFDKYVEVQLPKPVPINLELNIDFEQLYQVCDPLIKQMYQTFLQK
jgi:hypothetical protein